MDKYTNYIYLTICEISIELFETTSIYTTYRGYCIGLSNSINDGFLSVREGTDFTILFNNISKIFGIDDSVSKDYVIEFFSGQNYIQFEKMVRLNGYNYPNDVFKTIL